MWPFPAFFYNHMLVLVSKPIHVLQISTKSHQYKKSHIRVIDLLSFFY